MAITGLTEFQYISLVVSEDLQYTFLSIALVLIMLFLSRDIYNMEGLKTVKRHFPEFLVNSPETFYFVPVTPGEVESEISLLSSNKSPGVYSWLVKILKAAKCFISQPLMKIMSTSIIEGTLPEKLRLQSWTR